MDRTSRLLAVAMGFVCLVGISVSPAWAAETNHVTGAQIQSALDKARALLLKSQAADGSWDPPGTNKPDSHTWGGVTALATYALLDSGSTPQDPAIVKAVAWLEQCHMIGVYCVGVRMQVWLLMYQQTDPGDQQGRAQYTALAAKDAEWLLKALRSDGPFAGLWTYFGKADRIDHSVSQYGVLGLWAAAQMGGEIPDQAWKLLDRAWRSGQFPDGGWSYSSAPSVNGT
ncbi:MAG TPA: hypothetical protein VHY37_09025, partial [Tepidisphaeraceae bacterium]|nr:hypothetical protein [Tepidisphaeraceae bacterium]